MDELAVDTEFHDFEAALDHGLVWPSSLSQDSGELQPQPCYFFEILGTEDTWQGRRFSTFRSSTGPRGMLQLVAWPVSNILKHVLDSCGIPHVYMMAMTCRSLRNVALRLIEEHAQDTLQRVFAGEQQLGKYVDSFGCFAWALRLRSWIPQASLTNWQQLELDAAYEFLISQVVIDETAHLVGLKPIAAMRWKAEGRRALGLFCKDCLTMPTAYRKILYHYRTAWAQVCDILNMNATMVRRFEFKGHSVTRRLEFSWPSVTVFVHCPLTGDVGMMSWTVHDVYNWFRLKKFPVYGLLDMQLDGPALMRLLMLTRSLRNEDNVFLLRAPRGLGMTAKQFSKLLWFVDNGVKSGTVAREEHQITFQVGKQR